MRKQAWMLALVFANLAASAQQGALSLQAKPKSVQPEAWQLFTLANQARTAAGIPTLQWDPALAEAARKHALRMSLEGSVAHRFTGESDAEGRASEAGAHFTLIEENLAAAAEFAQIHQRWMDSTDDRSRLLNPEVDSAGIAVVTLHGMVYAVADYAHAAPLLSQAQAEAAVATLLQAKGLPVAQDHTDSRTICAGRPWVSIKPSAVAIIQDSDLTRLPEGLLALLAQGHYRKAAVGSCPARAFDGHVNQYRVAVLLYSVNVGVF
jgi:hypothetical protein